ncbi:class II aldolase/adducin family protein [Sphaerochaeta sp. PS]|uniref:class II aldolase/adducin family protein n=1 Tax=Sphaerochaeta sp. PS TaxID=3076336 RepID=UPI0028A2F0E8|nr:class II aldolase/adducin family protein [Sphaerochaeta sp. PS]MDT4761274.1 class II aldolase/adducin family protein [Sphaerochaeta sp. PS]
MSLQTLIEESRRYGSDSRYVLLGGGNTSYKDGGVLYVKASGWALSSIGSSGFVRMDLARMETIWDKTYSTDDDEREEEVLKDMMASRLEGESARPSVEALLHALLPFTYVVHLHPALVNGITCSVEGQKAVERNFPDALWIELVKPGFILAKIVRQRLALQKEKSGKTAQVIFLQNHGVFVGGATLEEIATQYDQIMGNIESLVSRKPDFTPLEIDPKRKAGIVSTLEHLTGATIVAAFNREFAHYLTDERVFSRIASSFTPDHIVYSGFKPLWVGEHSSVEEAYATFEKTYGCEPKIICVQNTGVFSVGEKPLPLFFDTVAVSVYSESFGGPFFMDEAMVLFIRNWEVEKYRSTQVTT